MKKHFYAALRPDSLEILRKNPTEYNVSPEYTYMCLWYGLLFAVCECFRQNRIEVSTAEPDMTEIFESLRVFRNAAFHVQAKYFSPKWTAIMEDRESVNKINRVHDEVGEWLLQEMKKRITPS